MSTSPSICVITPTYNEKDTLPVLVRSIFSLGVSNLRMIVVDDNSPDGTGAAADALARTLPLLVVHREKKEGLGRAYSDIFQKILRGECGSVPDVIVHMDADISHDPRDIPRLLVALGNADIVIGSRYVSGGRIAEWGILRRMVSRFGNMFTRSLLGLHQRDCTSGFRAYRREALTRLQVQQTSADGYSFLIEMSFYAAHAGLRIAEVPIVFTERKVGASKFSARIFFEGIHTLFTLYFRRMFTRIKGI